MIEPDSSCKIGVYNFAPSAMIVLPDFCRKIAFGFVMSDGEDVSAAVLSKMLMISLACPRFRDVFFPVIVRVEVLSGSMLGRPCPLNTNWSAVLIVAPLEKLVLPSEWISYAFQRVFSPEILAVLALLIAVCAVLSVAPLVRFKITFRLEYSVPILSEANVVS